LGSKSAQKAARAAGKRQERNKSIRRQVKTDVAKAEKLISEGNKEAVQAAVTKAVSALDKAAEKKVLHNNNASRRKSRLLKKLNKPGTASKAKAAPEKAA
jgi:small subunit ribosomal protein S20